MIIKALSRLLIERGNYFPVIDENGNVVIDDNRAMLHRYGPEGYVVAEIVSGDLLTPEQIKTGLEMVRSRQEQIKERFNTYYFKVFVFSSDLPEDKLEILASENYNEGINGNYLCCISVNVEKKEFAKYYEYPRISYGIHNQIQYFFSNDFDSDYGNVDFKELAKKNEKGYKIEIKDKKPWVTYVLIAVNILVWLLIEIYARSKGVDSSSLLVDFGAKENTHIMMGEYWRFVTPMFLHNGITHLVVNSYSLYVLGTTVEMIMGKGRFLFIYLMAGLMGSIVSFIFSIAPSVGASGAIFGLLGALIYYGTEHRELFKKGFGRGILTTLLINIVYGLSVPRIDNFGHFGGLLGGFLASGVVGLPSFRRSLKKKTVFMVAAAVILSTSLYYGFTNTQNQSLKKLELISGFLNERNWVESEKLGEEIIKMHPKNEAILFNALWNLAMSEAKQGKYDEAVEHAQMLTEVDPANGHFLLGIIYNDAGNVEMSKKELEEAVKIDPRLRNKVESILNTIK